MPSRIRRLLCLFMALSMIAGNLSCTKLVHVPLDRHYLAENDDHRQWIVKTKQGRTYWVASFSITDSTLAIDEFDPSVGPGRGVRSLPHVLKLEDVASVEKLEYTTWNTVLLGSGAAVLVVGALYLVLLTQALSGLD